MGKIPVGKTIAFAYSFTFGNFLTVLGLSWASLAIMTVAAYFALPPYIEALRTVAATQDPTQVLSGLGWIFLFGIVAFACFNMIYVAIARQALGLRTGPAFFYFSLDGAFWRLLLAYFLTFLLIMAIGIGIGIVVAIVAAAAAFAGSAVIAAFIPLLIFIAIIYFALRIMFLLAPVAVAEGHHVVRRSWSLTKGNFWRIFGVIAAAIIPLMLVQVSVQLTVVGSLALPPPPPPGASPLESAAYLEQVGSQLFDLLPWLAPLAAIFYAAFIALFVSASAFAYRSLVPAPEGAAAEFA